ncbi:MAG: alpha/beta fold hydrolase [Erythrobacter sp.]
MAYDDSNTEQSGGQPFGAFFDMQGEAFRELFSQAFDGANTAGGPSNLGAHTPSPTEIAEWTAAGAQLQKMWLEFASTQAKKQAQRQAGKAADKAGSIGGGLDPARWLMMSQSLLKQVQPAALEPAANLAKESLNLWQGVLGQFVNSNSSDPAPQDDAELREASLRKDRRFADPAWRSHPAFTLLHQNYLMLAEYFKNSVRSMDGVDKEKRKQLEFAVTALVDAMSPDNFMLSNPVVMKRTMETRGQNLVRGMKHLINDLERGQLTHTDSDAFTLGENLAASPGKVVHQDDLFQLIQYSPTTKDVFETPLVIFPPWINRFYILDLTPKKSFIKWAVDQGISVFVVSWKSADASMKDVVWDDYIAAQSKAIDLIRERLDVPSVHTIGYCVAGTTLAATLAVLARRDEAEKVKSATFFTAQVDFEKSGELKNFIDDGQLEMISSLSPDGYVDGRYLAAAFNALRGKDLIWNYVVNNYLLGDDYPAFDLLHWNGDVTNLPARWHGDYLRDLYRDNKLVVPDAMSANGTPIDLSQVSTPSFVQAGREDHIAPAESVWRLTDHFKGPLEFLLAGSGHIAGVVNPPAANKYQYWLGDSKAGSLNAFVDSATEHPGSWWPHWLSWLEQQAPNRVPAKGRRKPGGRGDKVIEDAPGTYVKSR